MILLVYRLNLMILYSNFSLLQPGRVARAVSLCLFNRVQLGQVSWPGSSSASRYSIPAHDNHCRAPLSATKSLLRQTWLTPTLSHKTKPSSAQQSEIASDNVSLSQNMEQLYDGLISLDENRLDEMTETDLISTANC